MKKIYVALVLFCTSQALLAQSTDPVFQPPSNYNFEHKVRIELGKSSSVTVFLSDLNDLPRLQNLDSLIRQCLVDLAPLKDSMADATARYYVDHFSDGLGVRKISLRHFPDTDNSYLVMDGELAAIKRSQDTVHLLGIIPHPTPYQRSKHPSGNRYYELLFSLDNVYDLQQVSTAEITRALAYFAEHKNGRWKRNFGSGLPWKMPKENSVTADRQGGGAYNSRDYLSFNIGMSAQNYRNYFAPGFYLNAHLNLSNRDRSWMHQVGVGWEPMFLFAKNQEGKLQAYRHDFLSISYGQRPVKDKNPQQQTSFTGIGSLGWMYYRQGDMVEKNTFRLSLGRFTWNKTHIDPLMYFNNFFRGVTPGIRIVQAL